MSESLLNMSDSIKSFVTGLQSAVKAYQKSSTETYDDAEAAAFYPEENKRFLLKYKDEITLLGQIKFNQYFVKWLNHYIYKNSNGKRN